MANTDNEKNGVLATITEVKAVYDGGQKNTIDSVIYENIKAYIIQNKSSTFSKEIGAMVQKDQLIVRVSGKKKAITERMRITLTHKETGVMGSYFINYVEPKTVRGRLVSIYLYLERGNE